MKKCLFFSVIAFTCLSGVTAQVKLTPGLLISTPYSEYHSLGAGLDLGAKVMLSKKIAIGIHAGYEYMANKQGWEDAWYEEWGVEYESNFNSITNIRSSFTYYLGKSKVKPYLGFDLGITKKYTRYEYEDYNYSYHRLREVEYSRTYFGFAPEVGIELPLSNHLAFDCSAKYQVVEVSYFSVKVGLTIQIGKSKE